MHLCTALITIAGDIRQSVQTYDWQRMTYAEIVLLRFVHGGDETVRNVQVFDEIPDAEFDSAEEKRRLSEKYGAIAEQLFPGYSPTLPSDARQDPYPADPADIRTAKRGRKKSPDPETSDPETSEDKFPG